MLRLFCRKYSKEISLINSTRKELFDIEFAKQTKSNKRRLEKITVECNAPTGKVTLSMNKHVSTPMDCARHIQEVLVNRSVIALVNDKPWDMNKPLSEDSSLSFINFRSNQPYHANIAFWRSCSFITNWVLENCFHSDFQLNLCSFPSPDIQSGSFVCDVQILYRGDAFFDPSIIQDISLQSVSLSACRLAYTPYDFCPLSVSLDVAEDIFRQSPLKLQQLPSIAARSPHRSIPLYKVGDHVDVCQGPLIPCTAHIGRYKLACVYPIETADYGRLYRFQGIAIPTQLPTSHTTFELLSRRAAFPNKSAPVPRLVNHSSSEAQLATNTS